MTDQRLHIADDDANTCAAQPFAFRNRQVASQSAAESVKDSEFDRDFDAWLETVPVTPQPFWLKSVMLGMEYLDDNGALERDESYRVVATRTGTRQQLVHRTSFESKQQANDFMRSTAQTNGPLGFASLDASLWATPAAIRRAGWRAI